MSSKTTPQGGPSSAHKSEPKHESGFVEKMFSGFGSEAELKPVAPASGSPQPYHPLHQTTPAGRTTYKLPVKHAGPRVRPDSPATEVMTDLTRVEAVTVGQGATVDDANHVMIRHGVRSLFVVGDDHAVLGIITATDVLGERPVQVAMERDMRHTEVLVHHVMTPAAHMQALELRDVHHARVGDIVETLKHTGRQHALVVDSGTVRGMFSLMQIARQLGLPPHIGRVARTFAEVEAALGR